MPQPVPHYLCVGEAGPGKAIFGNLGASCYMPTASSMPAQQPNGVQILLELATPCLSWQRHSSNLQLPPNAVSLRGAAICRVHAPDEPADRPGVTSTGDHVGQLFMDGPVATCRYELYRLVRVADSYEILVTAQ